MILKTEAIVLRNIKYRETSLISHMYTASHGRLAFNVQGVRKRKTKLHYSLFQPLTILDLDIYFNEKKNIHHIKDVKVSFKHQHIPFDVYKNTVAQLLAEFLYKTIREEEKNTELFRFIKYSVSLFDEAPGHAANFHLIFLTQLSKYLGFYPDPARYSDINRYFDLTNGLFTSSYYGEDISMNESQSRLFNTILEAGFNGMEHIKMNKSIRIALLEKIIHYYRLHIDHFGELKSLKIFKSIFDE